MISTQPSIRQSSTAIELMNGVMKLEGVKACYLKDPDGIMIELIQWNADGNPFLKM